MLIFFWLREGRGPSGPPLWGRSKSKKIGSKSISEHLTTPFSARSTVNNIPTDDLRADMGTRTDILFTTGCAIIEVDRTNRWPAQGDDEIEIEVQGGGAVTCYSHDKCYGVKAVLFRSYHRDSCGGGRASEWVKVASKSGDARFGLGFASDFVSRMAHALRVGPYCCDPTTGFHAVLTMAFMCGTVELYGFSGTSTINNHHGGNVGHGIEQEHALLRALANRTVPDQYMPDELRTLWSDTHIIYNDDL